MNLCFIDVLILRFLGICLCISSVGILSAIAGSMAPGGLGQVLNDFFSPEKTDVRDQKEATRVDANQKDGAVTGVGLENTVEPSSLSAEDVHYLKDLLKRHIATNTNAFICLTWTLLYFVLATYLMHIYPSWWSVLFMGTFHVRAFIIFHDACHMSFFPSTSRNKILAQLISAFVPQNASDWTASHNFHHSHLGDSAHLDLSLTIWFNQREYQEMPLLVKIGFRIIRDPILLPMILSMWVFIVFPFIKSPSETLMNRAAFYLPYYCLFGFKTSFLYLVASWVGGMIGLQLFHLQHQCNSPYRVSHAKHSMWDAGIVGSTHLLVPWPLSLMTLGIEFHHIHHACTRVPCYHLATCHNEGETRFGHGWLRIGVNRVGFTRAFLSTFHCLFEDSKVNEAGKDPVKFVSFEPYQSLGLHD